MECFGNAPIISHLLEGGTLGKGGDLAKGVVKVLNFPF